MNKNVIYRNIPKVDVLLENPDIMELIARYDRETVVAAIRDKTEALRIFVQESEDEQLILNEAEGLISAVRTAVEELYTCHLKPVINGTGTILHTNLGRAPLSREHGQRIKEIITGYSNLEYDLEEGRRGERYSHFEELLCKITGAEAAIAVNNNAAAVILILSTLTTGKEVIVSRGELVEIGGKFRIPEVMEQSGSILVEVGTTNKTHIEDYENAITEETSALMKVHTSNYQIVGFTETVSRGAMVELAAKHGIPLIEDLGSGVLVDLSKYGLTYEPTVQDSLKQGVSVVCFSGDKLLGGPQAGIIVGKKEYIDSMKRHPLTRALRIDKFSACALELVFQEYLSEKNAIKKIPVLEMIQRPVQTLTAMAERLMEYLEPLAELVKMESGPCHSQIGGGSMPMETLVSKAVFLSPLLISATELETKLRNYPHPIITRVTNDRVQIDMRTLFAEELPIIAEALATILKGGE